MIHMGGSIYTVSGYLHVEVELLRANPSGVYEKCLSRIVTHIILSNFSQIHDLNDI